MGIESVCETNLNHIDRLPRPDPQSTPGPPKHPKPKDSRAFPIPRNITVMAAIFSRKILSKAPRVQSARQITAIAAKLAEYSRIDLDVNSNK